MDTVEYTDLAYGSTFRQTGRRWQVRLSHRHPAYNATTPNKWRNLTGEEVAMAERMLKNGKLTRTCAIDTMRESR